MVGLAIGTTVSLLIEMALPFIPEFSNMVFTFFLERNKILKKLYEKNIEHQKDHHYGTFDQFMELIHSFSHKRGFEFKFDNEGFGSKNTRCYSFTVKSDEGTEVDFDGLKIKITIDRDRGDPLNLGEPIWLVQQDGTRKVLEFKRKNTRIYEYFVFSSLVEFYKFVRWTNKGHSFKGTEPVHAVLLDVRSNYWNLDRESKKIYNMKGPDLEKVLQLDKFSSQFKELEHKERLMIEGNKNV